jgi:hypothetical protein
MHRWGRVQFFGAVVVVDARLSGVQVWGRNPLDVVVVGEAGAPALGPDHPVVGSAGQGEVIDVG